MQDFSGEEQEWTVTVETADAGSRLDAGLARAVPVFSRNRIKDLILGGAVSINGQAVTEPKYKLREGEEVTLTAPSRSRPSRRPRTFRSISSTRTMT